MITKEEYKKKVLEACEHDRLYYRECKPIISDYAYDLLIKEIEEFERANPTLILAYSPTQRVGEAATHGFKQGEHETPMLSLANTYNEEELKEFIDRVYRLLKKEQLLFCVELKMDGTAISIRYENGQFVRALTRGDGRVGDDVTNNVKTIKSIPLLLQGDFPPILEVRGEVFMSKKTFQDINRSREEAWANPRNAAAGSLKLLDPKEIAHRKLEVVCYAVADNPPVDSQFKVHSFLRSLGLPTASPQHLARCGSLEELLSFAKKIKEERHSLPFEIDGIVVKVDDIKLHPLLGTTGKSPRFAVAYKFAPEQAATKIEDITVQVGRTGVLTPVAELTPVLLAGSTISRATLHNEEEVARKDIRIGDFVLIEKGGDVIPKVVSVDLSQRPADAHKWHMPSRCPVCHTEVVHVPEEVAVRCPNPQCLGRRLRYLIFFAGKAAMDIENMGSKVVEKLVDEGLISRPSDIYLLTDSDLSLLDGFKEKSIKNLLDSIEKSKNCTLSRFILSLEIKHVGEETAELLADRFESLEKLMKVTSEDLLRIDGIGEKTAIEIVNYFQDPSNQEEVALLLKHGVKPHYQKRTATHSFSNKTFVLTGALQRHTRDEAVNLIRQRGGKVSNTISKKTDFVVAGDDPGSKLDKAKSLNIRILTEDEFEALL